MERYLGPSARLVAGVIAVLGSLGEAAIAQDSPDLVRVDYLASSGVFSDLSEAAFTCEAEDFDYADSRDDVCVPDPAPEGIDSDLSGGGRWKFSSVVGSVPIGNLIRGVGFDFSVHEATADCTRLADLQVGGEVQGPTCSCGAPCFAQARMNADRVFKRNATRQAFLINLLEVTGGDFWQPRLTVEYVDPLYICPTADLDVKVLQTDPCPGDSGPSVAWAELSTQEEGQPGQRMLGRWRVPLFVLLRRVPAPDGGGGGSCELGQKGDPCSGDAECCSSKCRGSAGNKTCK